MFDSNTRPYSTHHRRNRIFHEGNFHCENTNQMEQQFNSNYNFIYQRSPTVHVPSFQQTIFPVQERHIEKSNQRSQTIYSHQYIENHLPYRMWTNTNYQDYFRRNHNQYFKFHLVCYNVLSQTLLEDNSFLYMNCLRNNLKWYRRKDRLLRELFRQNADIFCLQEMENDHYESDFLPRFMENGYSSIYIKRNGDKPDGCCLFYKTNRFKLINSKAVSFYQPNIRILHKDNCGLIALFQLRDSRASSDDLFCIATTHLIYSPKCGDIKLAQLQYFLAEIDQFATKDIGTNSYYPIILCGDFNARPDSPLINFLLNRFIKYDIYRSIDISGQTTNNNFSYLLPSHELLPLSFVTSDCRFPTLNNESSCINQQSSAILTHNKRLRSVYDLNNSFNVTTNAGDKTDLVDYIFYTDDENDSCRLNLLSRFDLYKRNEMIDIHMPNHQFPSDHFLLAAKFSLKLRRI